MDHYIEMIPDFQLMTSWYVDRRRRRRRLSTLKWPIRANERVVRTNE